MAFMEGLTLRMFGRPQGLLGRLGGHIMASANQDCGLWVIHLLQIHPRDDVLEVGFGSGAIIEQLTRQISCRRVAGIDASDEMVRQARARNAVAISEGRVHLRGGSVQELPFADASFDKAFAINSMQVWPDPVAGLREIRRVLKSGGRIALGFTAQSRQPKAILRETVLTAGFRDVSVVERESWFCGLGTQ